MHDHTAFFADDRDPALARAAAIDPDTYELAITAAVDHIRIRRGKRYQPPRTHLTGDEIGKLVVAGALVATAIAFLIDPAGAAAALLSIVRPW